MGSGDPNNYPLTKTYSSYLPGTCQAKTAGSEIPVNLFTI